MSLHFHPYPRGAHKRHQEYRYHFSDPENYEFDTNIDFLNYSARIFTTRPPTCSPIGARHAHQRHRVSLFISAIQETMRFDFSGVLGRMPRFVCMIPKIMDWTTYRPHPASWNAATVYRLHREYYYSY